jgi:hypothetical protein
VALLGENILAFGVPKALEHQRLPDPKGGPERSQRPLEKAAVVYPSRKATMGLTLAALRAGR